MSAPRIAVRAARTRVGQRMLRTLLRTALALLVDVSPDARLATEQRLPRTLRGFEDLAFLFTSTPLDYGIAQLTFEEAAYLYRTAREAGPATLVEIGRYRGGSTLVLAAAMEEGARLVSYDAHAVAGVSGEELDAELSSVLERYGLADRVELVVADSRSVQPRFDCGLVFVDGDHSVEGVRADYEHWKAALRAGGHLLFHDAPSADSRYGGGCGPVGAVVAEIEREDAATFRRAGQAGTIAHFVRTR